MQRLYGAISRVAPSDASVLVTGESGTGKDVVARAIAQYSRRHDRPLLAVNCGAISPGLIESEMFGHLRGSFTGATRDHVGLFERADGGTLFLDEICEMPLELQAKLLRVLEAGAFLPVGAEESRTADVRIIAATNRSPRDAVAEGRLREDLFYRLNVFPLHMPTLRERQGDIPLLAAAFLREVSGGCGRGHRFSPEALQRLLHHPWPGNVRELRNSVVRAHVMSDGPVIGPELVLPGLERPTRSAACPAASQAAAPRARPATGSRPTPALRRLPSLAMAADIATDIAGSTPAQDGRLQIVFEIGTDLADIERQVILATLQRFDGHRERTAIALGLSPKTLYNRLREYEAPPGRRGRAPAAAAVPLPAGAGLPLGFPGLPPGGPAPGDPLPPAPTPDIPGPGDPSTPAEPPPPVQTPPSASLAAARAWTRSSPLQCRPDQ
jgi:DNA-binding NtrC family response regulator